MIWGRLGLGKRKTEAGHSVLPAARRVSAPGLLGNWRGWGMGHGYPGKGNCVRVSVRVRGGGREADWTPHRHRDSRGLAGAVGRGFKQARRGLGGPSSSYPTVPNLDLRLPLPRGRWKRVFLPRPWPHTARARAGLPPSQVQKQRRLRSLPHIRVRGSRRFGDS